MEHSAQNIFCSLLLRLFLVPFILTFFVSAEGICKDSEEKFQVNGKLRSCWGPDHFPQKCSLTIYKVKCPDTCNAGPCCKDHVGKFDFGNGTQQSCWVPRNFPSKCHEHPIFQTKCPVACGTCYNCANVRGKFWVNGQKKNCWFLKKNPELCQRFVMYREKCPETCGICQNSIPSKPTSAPTLTLPLDLVPSSNESCVLKADLSFPSFEENPNLGYHDDALLVRKNGHIDEPCAASQSDPNRYNSHQTINTVTSWGCTHIGDAKVWNPKHELYGPINTIEHAIITSAEGGSYQFEIQHIWSIAETYYRSSSDTEGKDHENVGVLTIDVVKKDKRTNEEGQESVEETVTRLGEFRRDVEDGVDTHLEDGSINLQYEGIKVIQVLCDEACSCQSVAL